MLLVKAFLKIFSVCSKLMKFALKRRKFAFLNRNKDADWRERRKQKRGRRMVSVLALSVTFGATSPKERGLGSPFAQKEKEKFTKKCKIGCVLVQNVVSYKGVQK
jgi:hypothetical protein